MIEMPEDGDSLFKAMAQQVYDDQECHQQVRKETVDYIEQNYDSFSKVVDQKHKQLFERCLRMRFSG